MRSNQKSGAVLVQTLVAMPVLIAVAGMVIDGGRAFSLRQDLNNAVDAAAKAVAYELMQGSSDLTTTAEAVLAEYGLPASALTVNSPPISGAYSGDADYAEVLVAIDFSGFYSGFITGNRVSVRAVAGRELAPPDNLISVLDGGDGPFTGIDFDGRPARLSVNGGIVVNSSAGGVDENDDAVSGDTTYPAIRNEGRIEALSVKVNGGVEDIPNGRYSYYGDSDGPNPLEAGLGMEFPDPYIHMPTPTVANGVLNIDRGAPQADRRGINLNNPNDDPVDPNYIAIDPDTGDEVLVLKPGVYEEIELLSRSNTLFEPGIYVLRPAGRYEYGTVLRIDDNARVEANGVMFYATSQEYDPVTGAPDNTDGDAASPHDHDWYGLILIELNNNHVITPIDTATYEYTTPIAEEFNGMLLYKRRFNNHLSVIELRSYDLLGSIYTRGARVLFEGRGSLSGTIAVRGLIMEVSTLQVRHGPSTVADAPRVVLVE